VSTLAPTVVPKLLATSFAPTANDRMKATTKPVASAHCRLFSYPHGTAVATVVMIAVIAVVDIFLAVLYKFGSDNENQLGLL